MFLLVCFLRWWCCEGISLSVDSFSSLTVAVPLGDALPPHQCCWSSSFLHTHAHSSGHSFQISSPVYRTCSLGGFKMIWEIALELGKRKQSGLFSFTKVVSWSQCKWVALESPWVQVGADGWWADCKVPSVTSVFRCEVLEWRKVLCVLSGSFTFKVTEILMKFLKCCLPFCCFSCLCAVQGCRCLRSLVPG